MCNLELSAMHGILCFARMPWFCFLVGKGLNHAAVTLNRLIPRVLGNPNWRCHGVVEYRAQSSEVQRGASDVFDAALPRVRLLALRRVRPRHEGDSQELPVAEAALLALLHPVNLRWSKRPSAMETMRVGIALLCLALSP